MSFYLSQEHYAKYTDEGLPRLRPESVKINPRAIPTVEGSPLEDLDVTLENNDPLLNNYLTQFLEEYVIYHKKRDREQLEELDESERVMVLKDIREENNRKKKNPYRGFRPPLELGAAKCYHYLLFHARMDKNGFHLPKSSGVLPITTEKSLGLYIAYGKKRIEPDFWYNDDWYVGELFAKDLWLSQIIHGLQESANSMPNKIKKECYGEPTLENEINTYNWGFLMGAKNLYWLLERQGNMYALEDQFRA